MELYLVRHGQSQANADNQLAGWYDVPLTEKGAGEARAAGEKLRGIEFEKVYASDLMRACQTCENALPGVEYEKTALIREISVGEFEGLYYDQDPDDERHRRFRNCDALRDYSPGGGESHQDQLRRVRTFLEMVPGAIPAMWLPLSMPVFCNAYSMWYWVSCMAVGKWPFPMP